jgi:SAM-dependent methyltransferase
MEWWNLAFDDRYEVFESRLPKERRAVIDIGCGPGYFLKRGDVRGWHGLGIEPSLQASMHAKGLGIEVMNAFLNKATVRDIKRTFDAAHLSEVLEHVPDPLGILSMASSLLNKGGVIAVIVPNDYSPVQKVLRRKLGFRPYWLAPPHHINYFSFSSLSSLMEKAGFEVIEKAAMFPIDFFLLMGEDYVGNDRLGRACHAMRKRLDINLAEPELREFKKDLYRVMARHSIGREMIVYGVKA